MGACGDLFEPAAAVVDGDKIPITEVDKRLDEFVSSDVFKRLTAQGDPQGLKRQVEQQTLSQLIRRAVLLPKAEELGIVVTSENVDQRLEEIKGEFQSENAFDEALKEQNLTLDQLKDLVSQQLLEEPLRAKVTEGAQPAEADIQAFYDQNSENFKQTRAQHILVAKKSLAQQIAQQLQAAPKNEIDDLFERLAKRYSTDDTNSDNAGDLGYYNPGDLVPEFQNAADALEIGEISDPVQSQFGFHVIRVTDRRATPLEDVRAQIEQQLAKTAGDKAWSDYLHDAFADADVKVNPRYGEFDLETLLVVNASSKDIPGAVQPTSTPTPEAPTPGG
jgi:parvulin-like peptidyl-prolyl isomerase